MAALPPLALRDVTVSDRLVPVAAGIAVIVIGLSMLAGSIVDLGSRLASFSATVPETALGFVLAGLALCLAATRRGFPVARMALEASLLAVSAWSLIHAFWGAGAAAPLADAGARPAAAPGAWRMAPQTAVCFTLIALALSFDRLRSGWGRGLTRTLATLVAAIGLLAFAGYVYDVPVLYAWFSDAPGMSITTAFGLVVLAAGAIYLQAEYGLIALFRLASIPGLQARWLLPAVVALPLVLAGGAFLALHERASPAAYELALVAVAFGSMFGLGLVILATNIRLRQAERELIASELRYREVFENVPVGLLYVAPDGRCTMCNAGFARMAGREPGEIVGSDIASWIHPEDVDKERRHRRDADRKGGHRYEMQIRLRGATDRDIWAQCLVIRRRHTGGRPPHYLYALIDISRMKELERSREARLRRMLKARADAEAANLSKDEFLDTIGHELRAPLHSALMWAGVLERQRGEEVFRQGIEEIKRGIRTQARLIEDMLASTRGGSQEMQLELERIDLADVVRYVIGELEPSMEAKTLRFTLDCCSEPVVVNGDPLRLAQIVRNLLDNAIKYTPEDGSVTVTVASEKADALVRIEDSGHGIAAEDLEKIGKRFWRGHAKAHAPGTGLGLAIVDRLMEGHGGILNVSSAGAGRGTTAEIRIPLFVASLASAGERAMGA